MKNRKLGQLRKAGKIVEPLYESVLWDLYYLPDELLGESIGNPSIAALRSTLISSTG